MAELNINKAEFIKSAAAPSGFIRDALPNIVFSGKSNVGKSSVINRLLNRKNFARVGHRPGKQLCKLFSQSIKRFTSSIFPDTATPRSQRQSASAGQAHGAVFRR